MFSGKFMMVYVTEETLGPENAIESVGYVSGDVQTKHSTVELP